MLRIIFSPPGSVNIFTSRYCPDVAIKLADNISHGPCGRSDICRGGGRVELTMVA